MIASVTEKPGELKPALPEPAHPATVALVTLGSRAMGRLAHVPLIGGAFQGDREKTLRRLIKFGLVGGSGVVVNMAALFLLHGVLAMPLLVASALAVELAIINNFVWNNAWTFRAGTASWSRFVRFNGVSLVGLVLSTAATVALVNGLGLYYLMANLVAIGCATTWNFVANSLWTWS